MSTEEVKTIITDSAVTKKKVRKPKNSELGPVISTSLSSSSSTDASRSKRQYKPVEFMGCVKTVPTVRKKRSSKTDGAPAVAVVATA
jgi:hypothetical protein